MKIFLEAYELAKECHRKQRRRGSGVNYIIHPVNVATSVYELKSDIRLATMAILHDVLEDGGDKYRESIENINDDELQEVLSILTYDENEYNSKDEYLIYALTTNYKAALIKVFDRLDNIKSLDIENADKKFKSFRNNYIKITKRIFLNKDTFKNVDYTQKQMIDIVDVLCKIEDFVNYLELKYNIEESKQDGE